ncbi:type I-F CRISPR-associated protein Csy3 [Pseudomonas entomophila]|uniref:type I-F CRISPR-associated protein Csy3 n=1 Tax=Pseudomonas entomophila TaxID=312306 RepID=UPI0024052649|nr:type I-F CRISPR-associated protein Csy3 [Pseudomonas entomophila]MDF9619952.1 type I-F CRISPR-associated protein Csy3 [Pseudomonas entomophila]
MTTDTLKTASVLAFERKLDPSDALFHAGSWEKRDTWVPIAVREKSVRGTISNRMKTKDLDPAKLDAEVQKPNLQTIDVATLPHDADTLQVSFTLRVLGSIDQPSACNDAAYRHKLQATVKGYAEQNGFNELAYRYACNLANARFLWRNRIGAEQVEVKVEQLVDGQARETWTFDALSLSLRHFDSHGNNATALRALAQIISNGLLGEQHVLLRITALARLGAGQEVFPSQELIMDRGRGDKSKTLYTVSGIAGLHSQKVGNAVRSIDTWYEEADSNGPIAVEPYGSVTTQGKAYRQPRNKSKDDFYSLLDAWVLKDKVPALEQQHFVIATLIRGGVFGEAG